MSNNSQRVKLLINDMISDHHAYSELNQLLEQQRQLIIGRKAAELDTLNDRLIEIYQQLSKSAQQRYRLLQQLGVSAGPQGIQALLARLPAPHQGKVSALWKDLEQQTVHCKRINEGNGALLGMQHDILQNLINSGEPENWLYQQA
ncbi:MULTISPECIES: flagella synthesis protein FlgN [unclassified Serratia (in: enterobacteria)]|uniref:flagella synthesis protein FlgN n=1 Tax=unclassified Serratia (in: enterobacteria) TaxID=2647522 RepID=UPI000501F74B|nr:MULTISPECIES: flagellar protein FlgN [unclassified Serratia (in: enterobacteria)]KFK95354.1 hypothetical protein JV45_08320 [Serratia sp. Ag2]KFK98702.1 hypothetical protein IV04_11025 [Serratia sp. Ag1]